MVACKVLVRTVTYMHHLILRAAPFQRGLINVPQVGALGNWYAPCSDLVEIPKELEVSSPEEDSVFPKDSLIPE